jgi:hypothetical protein
MQASEGRRAVLQQGTTDVSGAEVGTTRYEVVAVDLAPSSA